MLQGDLYAGCPVQCALQFLAGKWKIGILWNLKDRTLRFGELRNLLPGITEKVLSQELRFFEEKGFVQKETFAAVPPKTEYNLTEKGKSLIPVIAVIVDWGYLYLQDEKLDRDMFFTPVSVINDVSR